MNDQIDFTVDRDNLYREDSITDLKTASIRCLTPVNSDGVVDDSREKIFVGHTQLMSPQGMVPLQAKLEASNFDEAMDRFPAAMQKAMEEMIENARRMHQEQEQQRRDNESRIIVPDR
jgi:hypothetical protein